MKEVFYEDLGVIKIEKEEKNVFSISWVIVLIKVIRNY